MTSDTPMPLFTKLADSILIYFVLKLADTWPIPILCNTGIIYIKPPIFTAIL